VERIQAYAGDRIVYLGESIDQASARVRAKILTAGQGEIPVEYRLSRVGARWAVSDVPIGGVSFVGSPTRSSRSSPSGAGSRDWARRKRSRCRAVDTPLPAIVSHGPPSRAAAGVSDGPSANGA